MRITDVSTLDAQRLADALWPNAWQRKCEILEGYMPPFPRATTRPTTQVRYTTATGVTLWLRYSAGPAQGFFWDIYGEDMQTPYLAVVAISQAPAPFHDRPPKEDR